MTVAVAVQDVSQPFQIGIGGFGFGSGGSVGVGVSAPVGGGRALGLFGERARHGVPTGRLVGPQGDRAAVERHQRADERSVEAGARRGRQGRPVLTPAFGVGQPSAGLDACRSGRRGRALASSRRRATPATIARPPSISA
jgi:hypothetical protein